MEKVEGILTELERRGYSPDASWGECPDRNGLYVLASGKDKTLVAQRVQDNPDLEAALRLATHVGVLVYFDTVFKTTNNMGLYIKVDSDASDDEIIRYLIGD